MTALMRAIESLEDCNENKDEEEDENRRASMTNVYILVAAGAKLEIKARIAAS